MRGYGRMKKIIKRKCFDYRMNNYVNDELRNTQLYLFRNLCVRDYEREKFMKRALIITTVSGFVPQFEMNNVQLLQGMGYEIHYATNYNVPVYTNNNDRLKGTGIIQHQIDFVRSPYQIGKNMRALKQLIVLMSRIKFHLVHCHTPMGSVLGRIAAHKTNTKPVIYTAHGFHFYKGAPVFNWLFFYPVERLLARWTDCLITINKEDYKRSLKFKIRNKVEYVPGVGVDLKKYHNIAANRTDIRKELGIPQDALLLISVGELTKRKNHQFIIQILRKCANKNIYYIICGSGVLQEKLRKQIKNLNLKNRVFLLGYRTDIPELLKSSDCFIFPSLHEGLPVAVIEALAVGVPVIASKVRGNMDLILGDNNHFLIPLSDKNGYINALLKLEKSHTHNKYVTSDLNKYSTLNVKKRMEEIYRTYEGKYFSTDKK